MELVKRTHINLDARKVSCMLSFCFLLSRLLHTLDCSHLCCYWCFHHEFDTKPFTLDLQMKTTVYKAKVFQQCYMNMHEFLNILFILCFLDSVITVIYSSLCNKFLEEGEFNLVLKVTRQNYFGFDFTAV